MDTTAPPATPHDPTGAPDATSFAAPAADLPGEATAGREATSTTTAEPPARSPLSRRTFLQAAAGTAALAGRAVGLLPEPAAAAPHRATLSFTAATNGAATLAPTGDRLVAEVQNILWPIPRAGGEATALTTPHLEPTRPVHAPDGETLAVCAYRGGGFHLWTLRPDGTGLRQLTDGPWDDRGPAWSPDGTRIAFASERGGDPVQGSPYRVWVIDVRSRRLTQLTGLAGQNGPHQDGAWEDFDPVWSLDGTRVFFVRTKLVNAVLDARTIASVPADGAGPVTVEHTDTSTAQLMTPALAPDGRLAYLRTSPAPAASCTLVVDGAPVDLGGDVLPVPPRWVSRDELLLTVGGQFQLVRPGRAGARGRTPRVRRTARRRERAPRSSRSPPRCRCGGPATGSSATTSTAPACARCAACICPRCRRTAGGWRSPRSTRCGWPTSVAAGPRAVSCAPIPPAICWPRPGPGTAARWSTPRTGTACSPCAAANCAPARRRYWPPAAGRSRRSRPTASGWPASTCRATPSYGTWRPAGNGCWRRRSARADCPAGRAGRRTGGGWHCATATGSTSASARGYNLIRVVNADSGQARLHAVAPHVSISDRYDSGPVWSPDGRHLAVVTESALWLLPVRPDGTPDGAPRQVTEENADRPSWSDDSRTLLYLSSGRLRLISADGGTPRTVRVALDYRRRRPEDLVVHAGRCGTAPARRCARTWTCWCAAGGSPASSPTARAGPPSAAWTPPGTPSSRGCGTRTPTPGRWPTAGGSQCRSSRTASPRPSRSAASPTSSSASGRRSRPAPWPGRAC